MPVNPYLYAFEQTTYNIQAVKTAVSTLCLTKCDPPPPFEKSWLSPCKLYIVYGITFLFDTPLLSLKVGTVTDAIFISGVPSSPDGRKTQFCGNLLSLRHFKNLKID